MMVPSTELVDRPLRIQRIDEPPATGPVRHFDELSERAQTLLYEGASDGDAGTVEDADRLTEEFVDGEVVVFTDYYRIQLR